MTELIEPRFICIGTHHKTGTIWMRRVFRIIARRLKLAFIYGFTNWHEGKHCDAGRAILYNWSSKLPKPVMDRPDARILHLIRDPRDVLVSGMRYHLRSVTRDEKFLHRARPELNNRSYQEHLQDLPDDEERLLFEMEHKHRETLDQMLAWDYTRSNAVEMRYEELIRDTTCQRFVEALSFLGFSEEESALGRRIFWKHSLFGGLAGATPRAKRVDAHIMSGRPDQWRQALPRRVAEIYAERHGAALVRLGYEPHPTRWLAEMHHA